MSHHCGHDSSPPIAVYMITGRPHYCDHLRPAPERSVRWFAQWAASMCMCMRPRARDGINVPIFICVVSNCYASWCNLYKLLLTTQLESGDWRKETRPGTRTRSLRPNAEFQPRKPPLWLRFFTSNRHVYSHRRAATILQPLKTRA